MTLSISGWMCERRMHYTTPAIPPKEEPDQGDIYAQEIRSFCNARDCDCGRGQRPLRSAKTPRLFSAMRPKRWAPTILKPSSIPGPATEFAFGQAVNPSSPWPGFADKSYTRTINYETPAWRVDRVLADVPPDRRVAGCLPVRRRPSSLARILRGPQQVDLWMTPYGFLREAANNNATVTSQIHGREEIHRRDVHRAQQSESQWLYRRTEHARSSRDMDR